MLLNIFTEFDITTDWKWILLAVGIVIAIIVIIVMLKKHFKTMLFLVFLIGICSSYFIGLILNSLLVFLKIWHVKKL